MIYLENFHSLCREYRAIALHLIIPWWSNTSHRLSHSMGSELSLDNTAKWIGSALQSNFLSNLCCWECKLNDGIPSLLATPLSLLSLTVLHCPSSLVHDSSDCELSLRRAFDLVLFSLKNQGCYRTLWHIDGSIDCLLHITFAWSCHGSVTSSWHLPINSVVIIDNILISFKLWIKFMMRNTILALR